MEGREEVGHRWALLECHQEEGMAGSGAQGGRRCKEARSGRRPGGLPASLTCTAGAGSLLLNQRVALELGAARLWKWACARAVFRSVGELTWTTVTVMVLVYSVAIC